jgi:hypothetical protein
MVKKERVRRKSHSLAVAPRDTEKNKQERNLRALIVRVPLGSLEKLKKSQPNPSWSLWKSLTRI